MKEIKMWSLAFTYVGCFLGAGFISGQELWQFFGNFGNWGYVGLAGAAVLFTVIGILFVRLTQMTQCADVDRLLVPWGIKWLRGASGVIAALFLFFVVMSMSAGVGAMLNQLFHVPTWLGSFVFMAAVFLVTLLGGVFTYLRGHCIAFAGEGLAKRHRGLCRRRLRYLRYGGHLPAEGCEHQPTDAQLGRRVADLCRL